MPRFFNLLCVLRKRQSGILKHVPPPIMLRKTSVCIRNQFQSLLSETKSSRTSLPYGLLSKRCCVNAQHSLKYEDIPGHFEIKMEESIRCFADTVNFFDEQYSIAQKFSPSAPMVKFNALGTPSVILLSHDLVQQWQAAELRGQTRRAFPPHLERLFGKMSAIKGKSHLDWRKKASAPFKPVEIDKYTKIVQDAAQRIVLDGIAKRSQETGEAIEVYPAAQRFAFGVGVKFVLGPYITEKEIDYAFSVC